MFRRHPVEWVSGSSAGSAVAHLCEYMASYTGRHFERFAGGTDPGRYEAADIIAVSCLSVDVPAEVSAWLILGDGQALTADLLASIPADRSLAEHDLTSDGAADALWKLLEAQPGLGPTTVSKLLAAKRPHLMPIYDTFVAAALLPQKGAMTWEWWRPWREAVAGTRAGELAAGVSAIRAGCAAAGVELAQLSDLRLLDIVIWRTEDERRRSAPTREG